MDKFTLATEEALLLIIDIQERLVPAMMDGEQVIEKTNILISAAVILDFPVLLTEQYPQGLGSTVSAILADETGKFEKMTFSGCTAQVTAAIREKGRKKIIIAGMETHVCVFQTVRDLLGLGYQVFVAADAVCSRAKENYKNALSLMREMGAVVTNTETILFDLLKESGTPQFKALSKMVK